MNISKRIISKNYTAGRQGARITEIVLHTFGGAGYSLYNWFTTNTRQASAHYAVRKDGSIEQYVEEWNTSWHAGDWGANIRSIGIEHQDDNNYNDSVRTNELYESSAQLIAKIYREQGWNKTDLSHIHVHREYVKDRPCPGALDINRIKKRVLDILNPNDLYFRVFKADKLLVTYLSEDVAFDEFVRLKGDKVTFKDKEDVTIKFKTRMTNYDNQIKALTTQLEALTKTNKELVETNASLHIQLEDQMKPEDYTKLSFTQILAIILKKLSKN